MGIVAQTMEIATERLLLRVHRLDDVPQIHAVLYGDARVRHWTGGPSTLAETYAIVERYIAAHERHGYSYRSVVARASGELVGEAGLKPLDDVGPELEIGYAFAEAHWGRGYATEAAGALLDEAFGTLGRGRVFATVREGNTASRHVLDKLGFAATAAPAAGDPSLLYHVLEQR